MNSTSMLHDWLLSQKTHISSAIEFKPISSKGNGLVALAPLIPEEIIATISSNLFINRTRILAYANTRPFLHSLFCRLGEEIDEATILIAFLIHERFLRPADSDFRAYIDSLPKSFETPVFSGDEMLWKGTSLEQPLRVRKRRLELEYKRIESEWRDIIGEECAFSLEDYWWADTCVWSRAISFHSRNAQAPEKRNELNEGECDDLHLIPFIDMANHSTQPNSRWELRSEGDIKLLDLVVTKLISQDEEICISYGDLCNQKLLFLHGFAVEENPHKSVAVMAPLFEEDPQLPLKMMAMRQLGLKPIITLEKRDGLDALDASGWGVMTLCVVGEEDGFILQEDKLFLGGRPLTVDMDWQNLLSELANGRILELKIVYLLVEALEALHQRLATADEELEKNVNRTNEGVSVEFRRCIEIFRKDERSTVEYLVESLNKLQQKLIEDEDVQRYLSEQS
ncbi:uncharacterized protein VTP21DRAFT_5704 [Calcarisporiella thermophila]|uniref:uncharacterized protein n=1 Tax=Calcarisporiella thermophila TaxID=911321 RepID=UPI00374240DE